MTTKLKPKSALTIRREAAKVFPHTRVSRKLPSYDAVFAAGAYQTLLWAMGDNAMRPSQCLSRSAAPKRKGAKR